MITDYKTYIKKRINYFEVLILFYSIFALVLNFYKNDINSKALTSINISCLIFNYFRGLISLQVFDTFRHLINMIFGVTKSILSTLLIFFYFSIGFTFLFTTLKENTYVDSMKISFLSILGNSPEEGDINMWICIILLGIMMSLILSNFLIAIMSSKYTELELKQKEISLQGQAVMIFEIETIMKYFKKKKKLILKKI